MKKLTMPGYTISILILLVMATGSLNAGVKEHKRGYYEKNTEGHIYKNDSGKTMQYRLFVPEDYDPTKKYPLVLSLHGAGSRGSKNVKHLRTWVAGWLDEEFQKKNPCIILMPQCPGKQQWVNTPWAKGSYSFSQTPISQSMSLAKEIVDKIIREKSIDKSRIYVMGVSMGGYGAWNFAMHYPDLIAALVPVCGGGDPSMADKIKDIPIWVFHGDKDHIVPLSGSKDMVDAIKKAGGSKVKFTIYEGVRHESYTKAWKEPELIEWVFQQRRVK